MSDSDSTFGVDWITLVGDITQISFLVTGIFIGIFLVSASSAQALFPVLKNLEVTRSLGYTVYLIGAIQTDC